MIVQGEADARSTPEDIERWRVRNASGGLVPFSNFADGSWRFGPQGLTRYNGVPSMQIQGSPAPGVATGEAMAEVERLAGQLGTGFQVAWTGLSLEETESGGRRPRSSTPCRWRPCSCRWRRSTRAGRSRSR